MKRTTLFSLMAAVLTLVVGGCGTTHTSLPNTSLPNTSVQVSGTPGTQFTAQYRSGTSSGTITTVTRAEGPAKVLKMPARELSCDVSKKDRSAQLTVEIRQGGQAVFRAESPAGTRGVRVSRTASGWQQETY